jgi:hypothetical protein
MRGKEINAHMQLGAGTPTCEMRIKIQQAISEMQSALQDEFQEDELKIHGVLGQGAFGTVYHGTSMSFPAHTASEKSCWQDSGFFFFVWTIVRLCRFDLRPSSGAREKDKKMEKRKLAKE